MGRRKIIPVRFGDDAMGAEPVTGEVQRKSIWRRGVNLFVRMLFVLYGGLAVFTGLRMIVYHRGLAEFENSLLFLLIFIPIASAVLTFFVIYDEERKKRSR